MWSGATAAKWQGVDQMCLIPLDSKKCLKSSEMNCKPLSDIRYYLFRLAKLCKHSTNHCNSLFCNNRAHLKELWPFWMHIYSKKVEFAHKRPSKINTIIYQGLVHPIQGCSSVNGECCFTLRQTLQDPTSCFKSLSKSGNHTCSSCGQTILSASSQ